MSFLKSYENYLSEFGEVGEIVSVIHPLVRVSGLPNVKIHEVVVFENEEIGWVTSVGKKYAEVIVIAPTPLSVGLKCSRSNSPLKVPVGKETLGHLVNSLGESFYLTKPLFCNDYRTIESKIPGIESRSKVSEPLHTGVAVVDLTIPLGKGQRELIIGDRKTGKTAFLLQTLLSQAKKNTICIYVCIGKKKSDIKKIESYLEKNDILSRCVVVASSASDPVGLIHLTPYYGMTLAEYFRDSGQDVLIIMDDLTTHAKYYREISLISKKFPGRSSYPGDVFYIHSRLLERAGNFLSPTGKTCSITCLPVAETVEGDISGYIQTNIMSITDGHIYFDQEIFDKGRRPAINYFLSVTRVGRQTQSSLKWGISRELLSFLTLLDKTEAFVHFGAEINEGINSTLSMGEKIISFFNQPMGRVMEENLQIVMFCLIWVGAVTTNNSADTRIILEKSQLLYEKDSKFRSLVDSVVSESKEFNALLGKVSQNATLLLTYLRESGDKHV